MKRGGSTKKKEEKVVLLVQYVSLILPGRVPLD